MGATRFTIDAVFKALDKFSGPVAKMTTRLDRFTRRVHKGMGGLGKMTKRVARNMRNMSLTIGSMAVLGGYALRGLLRPAHDFESAMAGVRAVTMNLAEQDMPRLIATAKKLGRTTSFTATEVGNAMEILGRAGLEHSQIADAVEPILRAAEAEKGSIQDTAKVVISAMKGMGIEFARTAEIANIFAFTSASAKTNIIELGEGLSKVAPVAKQFGMQFDEVTAAVAVLQDVGVEASMSGTQMKTMFTKLAMLTPKAEQRFRRLGISISKDGKNMRPLADLIGEIAAGLDKAGGNVQKVKAIATAVGLRGSTAANILADAHKSGRLPQLLENIRQQAQLGEGAAREMARIRMDTLAGDLIRLKSAWEGFRIDIAQGSMPVMRDLVQEITEMLTDPDNIAYWAEQMNAAAKNFKEFWSSNKQELKELAGTSLETARILAGIVGILGNMLGGALDFGKQIDEWATSMNDSAFGQWFNSALGLNPDNTNLNPGPLTSVLGLPPSFSQRESVDVAGTIVVEDRAGVVVGAQSEAAGMSIEVDHTGMFSGGPRQSEAY